LVEIILYVVEYLIRGFYDVFGFKCLVLIKRADHLSVSKTADVHDLSGKWMDDGQPHQYSGHWSWVYLFNNESVDENGVTVFDWMGSLVK
jgi:hypothetical protein